LNVEMKSNSAVRYNSKIREMGRSGKKRRRHLSDGQKKGKKSAVHNERENTGGKKQARTQNTAQTNRYNLDSLADKKGSPHGMKSRREREHETNRAKVAMQRE